MINLKLGGVETRVVNCNNECIYCMVPRNADKGTIEISIGDQAAIAPDRFTYIPIRRLLRYVAMWMRLGDMK